jgi:beta-RFAP synthase
MIRVQAPSRLHFGLLSLPAGDRHGQAIHPVRRFGSVGLMVQEPGLRLTVEPAAAWSAEGPLADRALTFAQRFAATLLPGQVRPHRIVVDDGVAEHVGLGTGTQLGLAVGRALATASGFPEMDAIETARRIGRGERSALGIHGFARGGFLVDGGKGPATAVAPLLVRMDFPEEWRIVLTLPGWARGIHGAQEREAFRRLQEQGFPTSTTDALCRLVLLGMLPALAERDLPGFGEALHDFNARVGDAFALAQGGTYAHPRLAEMVEFLRRQGVAGVGQSSWGPTVFAVVVDEEQATALAERLRQRFALTAVEAFATAPNRHGASLTVL